MHKENTAALLIPSWPLRNSETPLTEEHFSDNVNCLMFPKTCSMQQFVLCSYHSLFLVLPPARLPNPYLHFWMIPRPKGMADTRQTKRLRET